MTVPRPNKPINSWQLSEPVVASRGSKWDKHAGPEHAAQYEPDGRILVDAMTHETVTEVDVRDESPVVTVAPEITVDLVERLEPKVSYDWQSERWIEGRTYHRLDQLVAVDESVSER